jgi:YD repeat-containing protein
MRKLILLLILTQSVIENVIAQGSMVNDAFINGLLPKIVNPSPEASALGKYGLWPVSHYTGIPNISIPIHNIAFKEFSLPITLNYHAGGVKVDDISSWTGLNWSLSAGGMIGRTVVGLPDDDSYGYAYMLRMGLLRTKDIYNLSDPADYHYLKKMADNPPTSDTESDIYFYNFAGISGKLFMDTLLNMHAVPANNIQFLSTPFSYLQSGAAPSSSADWVIADDKGNIYQFLNMEKTRTNLNENFVTTGMYLSKIILAGAKDTIYFEYEEKSEIYRLAPTQSLKYIINKNFLPQTSANTSYGQILKDEQVLYNGEFLTDATHRNSHTMGRTRLKRILWSGGKIDFSTNVGRQDMVANTGEMLKEIKISDNSGQIVKSFELRYNYIGNRYFLESVLEFDKDKVYSKPYYFEYDNAALLPARNYGSGAGYCPQDHWGYYNGAPGNTSLLPPNSEMPFSVTTLLNGNREPDTVKMKYGTLSKITYPTKGYTEFDYESNRYDASTSIIPSPPAPIVRGNSFVQMNMQNPVKNSIEFEVPFSQNNGDIKVRFFEYAHPPSKTQSVFSYARLERKQPNGSYLQIQYWDSFDNFPTTSPAPNGRGFYDYEVNQIVSLAAGQYRIVVNDSCPNMIGGLNNLDNCLLQQYPNPEPDGWLIPRVDVSLSYDKYGTSPNANILPIAGGLRIKKTTSYASPGELAFKKVFEYGPGSLVMYPSSYIHKYAVNVGGYAEDPNGSFCDVWANIIEETSTNQTILGFTQGSTVGYTDVVEKDIDALNNDVGYTNYRFSFFADSLNELRLDHNYWSNTLILNSSVPVNSFDYKRGLLLSKTIYKKGAVNYFKVDSINNNYNFNDYNPANHYHRQTNLRVKRLRFGEWRCAGVVQGYSWPVGTTTPDFSYSHYDNITSWVQLVSSTHTQYDQDGNNPLTVLTSYEYNNKNLLAKKITTQNSKGGTIVSNTTYPVDYTLTGSITDNIAKGVKSLQDHFVIGAPVEQFVQKADANSSVYKTISSAFITYKPLDPSPDVIFKTENKQPLADFTPAIITASNSLIDPRYKPVLHFNKYDSYGNILEQQKANDVKEVYLWGHQSQYPVVKIIGSDLATVLNIPALDTSVLNNGTPAQKQAQLTLIRNHFAANPLVQVFTYTYQPLVGMTSETDPAGRTIYYEYDTFNRLKLQKDEQGNILKKYCYNYAGQPVDCN